MKTAILAKTIEDLVRDHHDAFVIEFLGADGSGLSVDRVQELVAAGYVDAKKLSGWNIPGMDNNVDPFLFTRLMSKVIDDTPPEKQHLLRDWSLDKWKKEIDDAYDRFTVPKGPEMGHVIFGTPEKPDVGVDLPPHGIPIVDQPPVWMGGAEREAYIEARQRAGQFARNLGAHIAKETGQLVTETWEGEDIVFEADADIRQEQLAIIREATGEALATHADPRELAVQLMRITGDWEHNWERIARTEIQAAYNDGRVLDAMDAYGQETQIARITEFNACKKCVELFNDKDGTPLVFPIQELLDNGTNVGKPRSAWQASIYPLHPNCKCDTVVVPPGLVVDEDGRLMRPEKTEEEQEVGQ